MKNIYKAIFLAGLGLSTVSAARAQEMLLGFTDTAASASAHYDYVVDLGAYTLFTTNANLSGGIDPTKISAGYSSVDANYLNDISVGAAAGASYPTKFFDQTVGFTPGLTPSQFNSGVGNAATALSAVQFGEYPSSSTLGWSYNVAQDPNTLGADPAGSVSSNLGNNMQYLSGGMVSEQLWSAVVGGTLRNPTITETLLGTLKVDLTHDQWTFTGASLAPALRPVFSGVSFSSGNLVLSGTNGTASTQYRVLMSTNLALGNWIPVFTNQFLSNGSFSYTNHSATDGAGYFRLVSP